MRLPWRDAEHLVSGLDVMTTVCDYAGVAPPEGCLGRSLRSLVEGQATAWREFVAVETHVCGRTIRTPRYKYVKHKGDPVEQLFDMKKDPWEMKNVYDDSSLAGVVEDHRKLLAEWEATLTPTPSPYPQPDWIKTLLKAQYG